MPPIRLSDDELDAVFRAARPLRHADRDDFLKAVAEQLSTCPEIGPGTVAKACRQAQKLFFDPPQLGDPGMISKYR
jgi:hypothetical protein